MYGVRTSQYSIVLCERNASSQQLNSHDNTLKCRIFIHTVLSVLRAFAVNKLIMRPPQSKYGVSMATTVVVIVTRTGIVSAYTATSLSQQRAVNKHKAISVEWWWLFGSGGRGELAVATAAAGVVSIPMFVVVYVIDDTVVEG